ncbi:hypothetical protein VTO58DRAFT_103239 [Aureobasidium pullulans]|nr:hypothetical protein JADG_004508 [Aureobasidium pullulans]
MRNVLNISLRPLPESNSVALDATTIGRFAPPCFDSLSPPAMELTTNLVAPTFARRHSQDPEASSLRSCLLPRSSPPAIAQAPQQETSLVLWFTSAKHGPGKYNEAESITCLRSREASLSRGTMLQDWSSRPVRVTVSSALTEDDSHPDKLRASRLPDAQD